MPVWLTSACFDVAWDVMGGKVSRYETADGKTYEPGQAAALQTRKACNAKAASALIQLVGQEGDGGRQIHRGVVVIHKRLGCVQRQLWAVQHRTHPFNSCGVGAVELDCSDLPERSSLLESPSRVQNPQGLGSGLPCSRTVQGRWFGAVGSGA